MYTRLFGAFCEVNEDLDKVIQCLAREAASSDEGLTISPLVNTDRKGGAYRIMLQQFRRAIAVTAANGHSTQSTYSPTTTLCERH